MAGVQADADALLPADPVDQRRELLERAPERPARAGRVLEQQRARPSDSLSASLITAAARLSASSTVASLSAEPGCRTTPTAPSCAPAFSATFSAVERLVADLRVLGGAVEQVDGVDHERLDDPRRLHRLVERVDLLVGVVRRALPGARLWLKIWIDRQARSSPRFTAFAGPPAGETWAPINIG